MNTFSCRSLWGNGQRHESDSSIVMCCLADTCWGLSFPGKQFLVPLREWLFESFDTFKSLSSCTPSLTDCQIPFWANGNVINECNKRRWWEASEWSHGTRSTMKHPNFPFFALCSSFPLSVPAEQECSHACGHCLSCVSSDFWWVI